MISRMAKTAVTTAASAPKTLTANSTPTHDEIAAQAYQIYLREGCVEGRDLEHWLQAEAELRGQSNGNQIRNGKSASATQMQEATTSRRNSGKRELATAK